MLDKIEEGSGVKATIILNGKEENFRLAVLASKGWDGENNYEYGFINEAGTLYSRGMYSGGATGFGITAYNIKAIDEEFYKSYTIVTFDLEEMKKLSDEVKEKQNKEQQDFEERQKKIVDEINSMPETFKTGDERIDKLVTIIRSAAEFNPKRNSSIQGGVISWKSNLRPNCYHETYLTKDGKYQVKKFAKDMDYLFGTESERFDPKTLLVTITEAVKTINKEIRDIKNK